MSDGSEVTVDAIRFDDQGLVPTIVQDSGTGEVLMMAYMSRESLEKTIATGQTWFYSRSRNTLWNKGATSGNTQAVKWMRADCDNDTLLVGVEQEGYGACHVPGQRSCFFQAVEGVPEDDTGRFGVIAELARVIAQRNAQRPEGSYTTTLFEKGVDAIAQKVGEEAVEVVIAAKNHVQHPDGELALEVGDLLYHLLVLAEHVGLDSADVLAVLATRRGKSGLRKG